MPDAITVVRQVYAAINRGDAALFDLLDEQIEWVTPPTLPWTIPGSDGTYRGHEELTRYFGGCLAAVDELRVEVDDLVAAGERVLALGYECGHSRATGKAFRARFAQLWTVADGTIRRLDGFPDTATMALACQPEAMR